MPLLSFPSAPPAVQTGTYALVAEMFAMSIPLTGTVPAAGWAHPAQKHGAGCWVMPPAPMRFVDSEATPSPALWISIEGGVD